MPMVQNSREPGAASARLLFKNLRGCLNRWRQPSWLPVMEASCRQFSTNLRLEAALTGRPGSCFVEMMAYEVAATPPSPERCGDFDCDEASQPPSRHLFYRAAGKPAAT